MSTIVTVTDALYEALVNRRTRLRGNEPEIQHLINLHASDYKIARDGATWKLHGWQNCTTWLQTFERMLRKTNSWNIWCGYEVHEYAWLSLSPFGLDGLSTRDYNLLFLRSILYLNRKQALLKMIMQSIIPELHPAIQVDISAPLADHKTIQKQVYNILFYSLEYSRLYVDENAGSDREDLENTIPAVLRRLYRPARIREHRNDIYLPTRHNETVHQVCSAARQIKMDFLTHTDLDEYIAISHARMLQRATGG